MTWLNAVLEEAKFSSNPSILDTLKVASISSSLKNRRATDYFINLTGHGNFEALINKLNSLGECIIKEITDNSMYVDDDNNTIFVFKEGVIGTYNSNKTIYLTLLSNSQSFIDEIKELFKEFSEVEPDSNDVYALIESPHGGLDTMAIGKINSPIRKNNYTVSTMKKYDHFCGCLNSNEPCGRLVILNGPPGTGKSFMIKSIVSEINATFLVMNASTLGSLGGPAILPTILKHRSKPEPIGGKVRYPRRNRPIVLILEDADSALISRETGNVDRISDLLNLGDGILGELADIRIIATTNTLHVKLDEAIKRPGRLCRHIELKRLTQNHAQRLYNELVGEDYPVDAVRTPTLAEVYRYARKEGWASEPEIINTSDGAYL